MPGITAMRTCSTSASTGSPERGGVGGRDLPEMQSHSHQVVMNRFVAACQADERVVAATLYGSYARDTADAYSDLDLGLITTDTAYEDFVAGREAFIRLLGEPLLLDDFDLPNLVFCIFLDGVEVEPSLGHESQFDPNHGGPYRVLLDKKNLRAGAVFPPHQPAPAEQSATLRRLASIQSQGRPNAGYHRRKGQSYCGWGCFEWEFRHTDAGWKIRKMITRIACVTTL